jgi:hypothetical protein
VGALEPGGRCNIDNVDGQEQPGRARLSPRQPSNIWLYGWAIDPTSPAAPDATFVLVEGPTASYFAPLRSERRGDLGANLGNPAYADAAFRASLDGGDLVSGTYRVTIVTESAEHLRTCATGLQIII